MEQIINTPLHRAKQLLKRQEKEREQLASELTKELKDNQTGIYRFFEKTENSEDERTEHLQELERKYNSAIEKLN